MKISPLFVSLFMGAMLVTTAGFSTSVLAENNAKHAPAAAATATTKADHKAPAHEIHWGYEGKGGPHNWGKIKSDFKACRLGKYQSPIDVNETVHAGLPVLKFDYQPAPLTVVNNGHTIQVNYPEGSQFVVDGTKFNLLQFHFHTPSENAINGKRFDMELHFVHQNDEGALGVVAVMIEEGDENAAAKIIWDKLPKHAGGPQTYADTIIDAASFLPDDRTYYRFMGSLTTPPCSEGVHWHVMKAPIAFSKAQIDNFKSLFSMNARPLQKQNNRLIILDR